MSETKDWIGVDLDGTLAYYDTWRGIEHIGAPIPKMVERVKRWLAEGREVRIFTARVCEIPGRPSAVARAYVEAWSREHISVVLTITNEIDLGMVELWDDRAVRVQRNTGYIGDQREVWVIDNGL